MNTPTITAKRKWNYSGVRRVCIENRLYTRGDCDSYENMLDRVDKMEPTVENIYLIAKDICEHSKNQTITNIMFILEQDAVFTFFYIDGSDEQ